METHTEQNSIATLRRALDGVVLAPGDAAYNDACRVFNGMIHRHPAVIAQCANERDVIKAVRFGRELGLEIAVRGGGHSLAGKCVVEGGLVIDLRRMSSVRVYSCARTATVAGGATVRDVDQATDEFGLIVTGSRVSSTGMGGFTLGGGSGWFDRKFGLACDNLMAVELVTADGRLLRASGDENAELFWALHGGGGNFGIATSFEFRLHALPVVSVAVCLWPPDAAPEVLRAYREFMKQAPDELGGGALFVTAPKASYVPSSLEGKLALAMLVVYAGPQEAARDVIAPMLSLDHAGGFVEEMRYAQLQSLFDEPPGRRNHWSALFLNELPDDVIDAFCARAREMLVPSRSQQLLFPLGGATSRSVYDYPVPWRHASWVVRPTAQWIKPADDDRSEAWVRAVCADMEPHASGDLYLNFEGDAGQSRIVAGVGQENYNRLARIKAKYDPDNVFHLNHNILPRRRG